MIANKTKIIVAIIGAMLLTVAIIAYSVNKGNSEPGELNDSSENNPATVPNTLTFADIWYGDTPDKITYSQTEDAAEQKAAYEEKPNIKATQAAQAETDAENETSENDTSTEALLDETINNTTETDIKRNLDLSEYADELAEYVDAVLIGSWLGRVNLDIPDSEFFSYDFAIDGTYIFVNDEGAIETGTYKTTHDPNNLDYHSALVLTNTNGERIVKFYISGSDPLKMSTDETGVPTYIKQ